MSEELVGEGRRVNSLEEDQEHQEKEVWNPIEAMKSRKLCRGSRRTCEAKR